MRAGALAALALAVGGGLLAYLLLRDGQGTPSSSVPQRPAPAVLAPTLDQKIAFFHGLVRSGKSLAIAAPVAGGAAIEFPVWRKIGGGALLALGEPAVDYLTSPERYAEYLAAPNHLLTVLDLLAEAPPSPGTFPFLAHWLDEANCPKPVPGSDWPEEIRVLVFAAMRAHPVPEAKPFCLAELDRPRRGHDLRVAAIDILLRLGEADVLNGIYRTLPPTADTPEPDLRAGILERLFQMAAPTALERNRSQVEALEPLLREALASPRAIERMNAMAILYRLGRPGMDAELQRFFEEHRANEVLAWSALKLLAADEPVPFVREACLARVKTPDRGIGFTAAVRLLAQWWPGEILPHFTEWTRLLVLDPYMVLREVLALDREMAVRWLREELKTTDTARLMRALGFVAGERVTELAPELLDLVRKLDPAARPPVYQALVVLRAPGVEALLLAELSAGLPDYLRSAVAVELLNLGRDEGLARLAELLAKGDGTVLDVLLRRAGRLGPEALPPALVPAVLGALRSLPGEDGRRAALLVLRLRGRFDDVREGLVEAYRYEPSRRVAAEILEAITELAHR